MSTFIIFKKGQHFSEKSAKFGEWLKIAASFRS